MSTSSITLWRQEQRKNFIRTEDLLQFLEFSSESREKGWKNPRFSCNVPRRLAEKMEKNCPEDPLFRQFVPMQEERIEVPGFVSDPVQDQTFCKTEKMLQKYRGRALLVTTSACAMHCRFCFRQNFPYEVDVVGFEKELEAISQDPLITEVILSGGDPLSLSDKILSSILFAIDQMPHIKRIRFHTRFPLGIPERIDPSFLQMLSLVSKQIFFVIHCNHPRELDSDVLISLRQILALKIPVLNQSVLLKGVNDSEEVLLELFEKMVDHGIIPYYLHQLDKVQGASHFLVEDARALELVHFLQQNLSGFAVPRLVREEPGKLSKSWISS